MARTLCLYFCIFLAASSVGETYAQSVNQSYTTLSDSGWSFGQGGAGNKKRIYLRVTVEKVTHGDNTYTTTVTFDTTADDQNSFGNWKFASELYNITYSLKYQKRGNLAIISKSGAISLNHQQEGHGILYDWTECDTYLAPLDHLVSLDVTAQRYGGTSGITVSYHR